MLIFIDESGSFTIPSKPNRVSCISALVVPESFATTMFRRFRQLTKDWRSGSREIKGSRLDEEKVASVIRLLKKFDVLFLCACIDMGLHTDSGISEHKSAQAKNIVGAINEEMHPKLKSQILSWGDRTRGLSNQLFVQSTLLNHVADNVLRLATLYYVQRIPRTLGQFKWVIDAKDERITPYEKLWHELVRPAMQSSSVREPMAQINGADYSAFAKFQKEMAEAPEYLKPHLKEDSSPFLAVNLNKLLGENIIFADSKRFTGLQMVDVLASGLTRACNGMLQKSGWSELGRLMVQQPDGGHSVRLLTLQGMNARISVPYGHVIKKFDEDRKNMLTKES